MQTLYRIYTEGVAVDVAKANKWQSRENKQILMQLWNKVSNICNQHI